MYSLQCRISHESTLVADNVSSVSYYGFILKQVLNVRPKTLYICLDMRTKKKNFGIIWCLDGKVFYTNVSQWVGISFYFTLGLLDVYE